MEKPKQKKYSFFSSLYIKIAAIFLIALIIVSAVYLYIAAFTAEMYYQEASQRLNEQVAEHIAEENQFFVNGKANQEALKIIFHNIMVINPSIEVYLLDTEGKILTYFAPNKEVKLKYVPLEPIHKFLEAGGSSFVMGADPKNEHVEKSFSAAKVYEGSIFRGYIYVILEGEEFENAASFVVGSYILRLGVRSMTITLIAAALLSLLALGFITRNLRKIIAVIRKFKDGDLNARIKFKSKSELGEFADSFNDMADTIVKNMEEIKTMDNLRRDLVANVSHDLRTPLATIQGYIETILIKADSLSEDEKKKYMQTILNSTDRLKTLVSELFELSKLEARETKPNPEAFSIAEIVQDIQQKNKVIAEKKNIELSVDFPYNLPLVYADIGMMERVLQNLLDNAIKFTAENGKVLMKLIPQDDMILVEVQDSGQGISNEALPHIFDRYQRNQRSALKENEGLGLGLAIVKRILEVHNLDIKVRSTENKGTVFSFNIPVYKSTSKSAKEVEFK
ncbi:MAG: HAMP domain-containing histidine kinase [Ignavibacteriaceae bacterium]|nr:HAMP domain-containing histidine kinase [Ignavibacteriaceae bacterium]